MSAEKKKSRDCLKSISLYSLTLKKASHLFMKVDPEKVGATEKEEKERRRVGKSAL